MHEDAKGDRFMSKVYLARRFVVGTDLSDAIPEVNTLHSKGIFTTLDILGEDVNTEEKARNAAKNYEPLIDFIGKYSNSVSNISLKASMLGLDVSKHLAQELLQQLLTIAQKSGVFVRIDMEGSKYTERTLNLYRWARSQFSNVGIVLQAYLFRTKDDLTNILNIQGRVRLCKGAYKESSNIAFQNINEIRENYLALAENLLKKSDYPAFATHDDHLISEIKRMANRLGRAKETFEFQMLYGLRRNSWKQIVDEGYRIRIYVPYGTHWFSFFYRRLRERKENVLFAIRNLL